MREHLTGQSEILKIMVMEALGRIIEYITSVETDVVEDQECVKCNII